MPPTYPEQSQEIMVRLFSLGLGPDRLSKVGAFIVAYGLFETSLERALWALKETDVSGVRPFTEKLKASEWFDMMAEGNPRLTESCNSVLKDASIAAVDLADYRNSLVHGQLTPFEGAPPSFLRNPAWHGEKRNKAPGDASTQGPYLDLAVVSAWTLFRVANNAQKALQDPKAQEAIENLKADVRLAKSYTNELRYSVYLYNHEKY